MKFVIAKKVKLKERAELEKLSPGRVYLATEESKFGITWVSYDGGSSWRSVENADKYLETLSVSGDGGSSWE